MKYSDIPRSSGRAQKLSMISQEFFQCNVTGLNELLDLLGIDSYTFVRLQDTTKYNQETMVRYLCEHKDAIKMVDDMKFSCNGIEFDSMERMCDFYNANKYSVYLHILDKGLDESLQNKLMSKCKYVVDGTYFTSRNMVCRVYCIPKSKLSKLIHESGDYSGDLTEVVKKCIPGGNIKEWVNKLYK